MWWASVQPGGRSQAGNTHPRSRTCSAVRSCAGMVRVARPISNGWESGPTIRRCTVVSHSSRSIVMWASSPVPGPFAVAHVDMRSSGRVSGPGIGPGVPDGGVRSSARITSTTRVRSPSRVVFHPGANPGHPGGRRPCLDGATAATPAPSAADGTPATDLAQRSRRRRHLRCGIAAASAAAWVWASGWGPSGWSSGVGGRRVVVRAVTASTIANKASARRWVTVPVILRQTHRPAGIRDTGCGKRGTPINVHDLANRAPPTAVHLPPPGGVR